MLAKIGPGRNSKRARRAVPHASTPSDVGRQQVGRELDAAERRSRSSGPAPWPASSCRRPARPRSGGGPRRRGTATASRMTSSLPWITRAMFEHTASKTPANVTLCTGSVVVTSSSPLDRLHRLGPRGPRQSAVDPPERSRTAPGSVPPLPRVCTVRLVTSIGPTAGRDADAGARASTSVAPSSRSALVDRHRRGAVRGTVARRRRARRRGPVRRRRGPGRTRSSTGRAGPDRASGSAAGARWRPASSVSPLNIPAGADFPLAGPARRARGLPTFVDNDAKALALGEGWVGAAHGRRRLHRHGGVDRRRRRDRARRPAARRRRRQRRPHRPRDRRARRAGRASAAPAAASRPRRRARSIAAITGPTGGRGAGPRCERRTGRLVGRAVASVANLLDLRLAVVAGSVALGFGDAVLRPPPRPSSTARPASTSHGAPASCPAGSGDDGPLVGAAAVGFEELGR